MFARQIHLQQTAELKALRSIAKSPYHPLIPHAGSIAVFDGCRVVESSVPLPCVLLCSQGLRGIELAGAPGRDDAGACGGDGENNDDGAEDAPVERAHAVEHLAQEPDDYGAAGETEDEADDDGYKTIGQGEAHNLCALCAEREPDAELPGALCDEIGKHAVEPDGGEDKRDDGEGEDENGVELILQCGDADVLFHGENVVDGKVWIHLAEDLLDGEGERFDIDIAAAAHG